MTKQVHTGKPLEQLVRDIEEFLLPLGFTISANERVYDENGIQIAEFDLVIQGMIQRHEYRWLIECRDRPQKGPQPGAWIEQLLGRKIRFKFNRVTAVSTTGFARGVRPFAEENGIELRVVTAIGAESIKSWFLSDSVDVSHIGGYLNGIMLIPSSSESEERVAALNRTAAQAKLSEPALKSIESGSTISAIDAFGGAVMMLLDTSEESLKHESQLVRLRVKYDGSPKYVVATEVGDLKIEEIIFDGLVSYHLERVPIQAIIQYSSDKDGQTIAQTATFELPLHTGRVNLEFHHLSETSETKVRLRTADA